jgi:hypothetical protein
MALSSCSRYLMEHDLFGKPGSTFPDHTLVLSHFTASCRAPAPVPANCCTWRFRFRRFGQSKSCRPGKSPTQSSRPPRTTARIWCRSPLRLAHAGRPFRTGRPALPDRAALPDRHRRQLPPDQAGRQCLAGLFLLAVRLVRAVQPVLADQRGRRLHAGRPHPAGLAVLQNMLTAKKRRPAPWRQRTRACNPPFALDNDLSLPRASCARQLRCLPNRDGRVAQGSARPRGRSLLEYDFSGKPVATFPHHALIACSSVPGISTRTHSSVRGRARRAAPGR